MRKAMIIAIAAGLTLGFAAGCDRGEAGRAASVLSAAEMEAALRAVIRNPDQVEGYIEQGRLVARLDAENLSGARTAFEEEVPTDDQRRAFVRAWARIDGAGAFDASRAWRAERRQWAMPIALEEWAVQDPSAALLALRSLGGEPDELLVAALALGWFRSGEPGAIDYVAGLPHRRIQQGPLNRIFRQLARTSRLEDTWRQADSMLENPEYSSDLKLLIFERALFHNVGRDPAHAARWVDSHLGSGYARRAARLVMGEWFQTDPAAALAWAESLPAEGAPNEAVSWGYMRWFDADREAAAAWLDATPLTPVLWGAVGRYARRLAKEDPEKAASWCEQLPETEPRHKCVASVGELWVRSDREAAAAWLAESDLPEEERSRILSLRGRPRGALGPAGQAGMQRPEGARVLMPPRPRGRPANQPPQ